MHETPMTTALALLSALLYAAAPPLLAVVQARDHITTPCAIP